MTLIIVNETIYRDNIIGVTIGNLDCKRFGPVPRASSAAFAFAHRTIFKIGRARLYLGLPMSRIFG